MSKILIKRGGNSTVSQYIGESGELIFDMTNKRLSVGDGSTKGGIQIANVSDLSNNNPTSYVVKTYRSGTNWYRKYNDGWIEQGGNIQVKYGSTITVTLPLQMSTTTYTIVLGNNGGVESLCNVPANTATVSGLTLDGIILVLKEDQVHVIGMLLANNVYIEFEFHFEVTVHLSYSKRF